MVLVLCVSLTLFYLQQLRDISRKKSAELTRLYSQMTDLGARQRALEEELARTTGERDA